jgi:TnpA family transposase
VLEPFIAGRIDEKLITAHWNDVLPFVTSIRTGAASASLLLKRLGAYPRQNSLALALREIGRIERTLFMLNWLELPGLRRQATAELNKGAQDRVARAIGEQVALPSPLLRGGPFLSRISGDGLNESCRIRPAGRLSR